MLGIDVHRVITPTIWGYATLTRTPDGTVPSGGATWRIDTVLPPELTPDELECFHSDLVQRPGRRRQAAVMWTLPAARRALRRAVDVHTSVALDRAADRRAPLAVSVALVGAMRSVADTPILPVQEPLARQLLWCGLGAARQGQHRQVLDAAEGLRRLAAVGSTGEAATG
jgi:hypothetical protein